MKIFLGAELEGRAGSKWFKLQKTFSSKLGNIADLNYGESLTNIAIISIIVREEFFEGGGYKERRYYSKIRKEADIRLRINYHDFVIADDVTREEIYISHILEAVSIAGKKAGKGFNIKRLIADIEECLRE